MEQKTEASQAVDEQPNIRRWQDRLPEGVSFSYGYAHIAAMKAEIADLRAALKAQPAPTKAAQGEDSARLDCFTAHPDYVLKHDGGPMKITQPQEQS